MPSDPAEPEPRLLTTAEAAAALGISPRRVRTLIQNGRLPAREVDTPTGYIWMIAESDLDAVRTRRPGYPSGRPRAGHPAEPEEPDAE